MEIVIRTDGHETVVRPDSAQAGAGTGTASGADVPEAVAAKASAIGANNAGAAPAAPGETGVPPANVTLAEELQVPSTGTGESAGAAPTPQGS